MFTEVGGSDLSTSDQTVEMPHLLAHKMTSAVARVLIHAIFFASGAGNPALSYM